MSRPRKAPKRSTCYRKWINKREFDFERRQYVPLVTSDDLDDLHRWLKTKKIDYLDTDPHELVNLKLVQEAFDALAKLLWNDSIELPLNSYTLKHRMKRHMPTYWHCSTHQAVLAASLYGCTVDFGPKKLRDGFTPTVYK